MPDPGCDICAVIKFSLNQKSLLHVLNIPAPECNLQQKIQPSGEL